jgi:hypothetical protein
LEESLRPLERPLPRLRASESDTRLIEVGDGRLVTRLRTSQDVRLAHSTAGLVLAHGLYAITAAALFVDAVTVLRPDVCVLDVTPPPGVAPVSARCCIEFGLPDLRRARMYARADVASLWLVDVNAKSVVVFGEEDPPL